MIGDILTTSEDPDQQQPIPTLLGSVNHRLPPGQKLFPYGLNRKIYVVNDRLAVGLAGLVYEMKEFLGELRNYFKYHDVTEENVEAFLGEFNHEVYPGISAILLYAVQKPEGILITYGYFGSWHTQSTSLVGDVFACGSGSTSFLRQASQKWTMPVSGSQSSLARAISANYILLGNILGQERLSLSTIQKHWGAGFEMIYFDGERFRNMDDITIVLWKGTLAVTTGKFEVSPLLFINYSYTKDGEVLVINVSDGPTINSYGVLPLYLRVEDIDKSIVPTQYHFDARHICFTYVPEVGEREIIGDKTFARTVSPTFYVEKDPNEALVFLPAGTTSPFRSTQADGGIPNAGMVKVDLTTDGNVALWMQDGIHETVIKAMQQVLLPQIGPDGQFITPPLAD